VGAFLIEHILVSNATAINGPQAYANQVKFLGSLPLVIFLESLFIWLPIAFHGGYGVYIWLRGKSNVADYPWSGNWMYTVQRYTGLIAFAYIGWHVYHTRFAGIDIHAHPGASFGKVQLELAVAWQFAFYVIGLVCACWHFCYGIFLFCAKWGIVAGRRGQRKLQVAGIIFFLVMTGVGLASLATFRSTPQQPADESADQLFRTAPAPATPPIDNR
jgi:succinate dehydrogenase / fumarate reductase cytochrome b subunit